MSTKGTEEMNTPLPWRVNTDNGQLGDISDADGNSVAQVQPRGSLRRQNIGERQAIAAHIVHCVNQHPSLLAALKGLLDYVERNFKQGGKFIAGTVEELCEQATAALAAAEPKAEGKG